MHSKFDDNKKRKKRKKEEGKSGREATFYVYLYHLKCGLLSEIGLEALVCSTANLVT